MVLSVTLNPCIDKTIYLDNLEVGAYNRVKNTRVDLSGKGLNVSTVLNNLSVQRALSERISSFLTSPTTS